MIWEVIFFKFLIFFLFCREVILFIFVVCDILGYDMVGVVVLDRSGIMVVVIFIGGIIVKWFGWVGDSFIVGKNYYKLS